MAYSYDRLAEKLCRKLHIGENLDIGCREYKFRKPKRYNKFLRRKSRTFYKKRPYQTRYKKPGKFWIKRKRTSERKRQCKCYLCGQEGHIRLECPELKKPLNERNRKTQVKINLINEYQLDSEEEELISELDFES